MNLTGGFKKIHLTPNAFLALVLAIAVGLIILLVLLLHPSSVQKVENTELQSISRSVRQHFQKKLDYRGLNTAYALENGIIPAQMARASKVFSSLSCEIIIGGDINGRTVAPFENTFNVVYKNLDAQKCQDLITSKFDAAAGLKSITVSNKNSYEFSYGGNLALPVSERAAKEHCSARNTVMFTFE
ncbi:MAG TPA: hypothetical protein DIC64_04925 [Alphaproteobacteria bacterium]|nr:hypothetical protein [Alphaproteobacteria bacterium]